MERYRRQARSSSSRPSRRCSRPQLSLPAGRLSGSVARQNRMPSSHHAASASLASASWSRSAVLSVLAPAARARRTRSIMRGVKTYRWAPAGTPAKRPLLCPPQSPLDRHAPLLLGVTSAGAPENCAAGGMGFLRGGGQPAVTTAASGAGPALRHPPALHLVEQTPLRAVSHGDGCSVRQLRAAVIYPTARTAGPTPTFTARNQPHSGRGGGRSRCSCCRIRP